MCQERKQTCSQLRELGKQKAVWWDIVIIHGHLALSYQGGASWEALGVHTHISEAFSICPEAQPPHPEQLGLLEAPLEEMMLKLKLQYFGHLMRRVDSLEKNLMLGGIGGRRRRGR